MARFDQKMQQAAPDLVLDHGDRITYEGAERDSVLRSEVADVFASIDVPPHHVCGNHDLGYLTAYDITL